MSLPRFRAPLRLLVLLLASTVALQAQTSDAPKPNTRLPKVLLIATGGTIAGVQDAPGSLGSYRAGTLTAEQIIASVPELSRFAQIETEQFSNGPSTSITPAQWLALSKRVEKVLKDRDDLAGVVVTHGTDRLEETAFFLYLTVRSDKPVIVVGAQRPATGISPDGPINLLAAVRVAVAPQAKSKGVMVVMDDRIISAREVRKIYQRTGGFSGGEMGMLGVVGGNGPDFLFAPTRRHGEDSEFDMRKVDSLPRVELTYSYPGGTGPRFDGQPDGVAVATNGMTRAESDVYTALRRAGVVVATVFAYGDNMSAARDPDAPRPAARPAAPGDSAPARPDSVRVPPAPAMVTAQHLTPAKARILLMVALTRTKDPLEIQRYFLRY
ncbi:asparaginase [Gemmatimonas groenlandica]|uniref:Asparaginase n=1 Tax=Gemmatimonas groenlandica TaxID=2732249 RepID=A0A6M4IRR6_9BACT|nr:asparaginase [Gemmatimonas groenlandica]QJR36718.1 asparaginase [Gemmatimonas groenlandica]